MTDINPALQGWSRVTREIVNSPLYRVAADIATRAGIAEGLIFAPAHEDKRGEIPTDRSLMSVTQAATALGVSRAAIHKAIQQKRLPARWYGNIVLVSREAVFRFNMGEPAQAAESYGKAVALDEALARADPDSAAPRLMLATSYTNRGLMLAASGRAQPGLEDCRTAAAIIGLGRFRVPNRMCCQRAYVARGRMTPGDPCAGSPVPRGTHP